MSLTRQLLAALAVTGWFAGLSWGARRAALSTAEFRPGVDGVEAILTTMVAALWFASLGHGGWWVLFLTLALFVEIPAWLRRRGTPAADPVPWRTILLGAIRYLGAGFLLTTLL
ncbi:MAG TPA: hypothetical protein VFI13_09705 [Gemmatimonadales bacterium]|nr:hypothetical protein [Gemmatimonadales bacterium]